MDGQLRLPGLPLAGGGASASSSSKEPPPDEPDASIDDLLKLIEDGPGARDQDVDELLQSLQPKEGSPFLHPTPAPGTPGSMKSLVLDDLEEAPQELDIPPDLPDPQHQLPAEVVPVPFIMVAKFHLRCELDLKEVAFSIRHAEYNPRKHTSITVRLFNPRVTALVRRSGQVMLSSNAKVSEDGLKRSAKKVARLVQRAGHPQAKFADYGISSILCKADLGFPVRLDQLASKFRRNALYEPEFFCSCVRRIGTTRPDLRSFARRSPSVHISSQPVARSPSAVCAPWRTFKRL
ncbi:unnamed protein product [Durusdinium trenchii]|uniref:Uncharacterized protein n=1 Tax=Durusdinium trenchii TaxID=1381693 RepID=A0ABP0QI84_9DINO